MKGGTDGVDVRVPEGDMKVEVMRFPILIGVLNESLRPVPVLLDEGLPGLLQLRIQLLAFLL